MDSKNRDIFKAYCKHKNIDVDYWGNYSEMLMNSFSYKSFELSITMKELRESIIDCIPGPLRRLLK